MQGCMEPSTTSQTNGNDTTIPYLLWHFVNYALYLLSAYYSSKLVMNNTGLCDVSGFHRYVRFCYHDRICAYHRHAVFVLQQHV